MTQNQVAQFSDHEMSTMVLNQHMMQQMHVMAEYMASSRVTVPSHLQDNVGDCMAVSMQATQWRMNPFAVAQKTFQVGGTLGYEGQLVNAVITSLAPVEGRLRYEYIGDWSVLQGRFKMEKSGKGNLYPVATWRPEDEEGLGIKVIGTIKGENEPREKILWLRQCHPRNSTQWPTDPEQQIAYLAVRKWARLHTPDVILGVYTVDELMERPAERELNAAPERTTRTSKLDDITDAETVEERQDTTGQSEVDPDPEPTTDQAETAEPAPASSGESAAPEAVEDDDLIPVPVLLESIRNCNTLESLDECKVEAARHPDGSHERNALVDAYRKRKSQIQAHMKMQER